MAQATLTDASGKRDVEYRRSEPFAGDECGAVCHLEINPAPIKESLVCKYFFDESRNNQNVQSSANWLQLFKTWNMRVVPYWGVLEDNGNKFLAMTNLGELGPVIAEQYSAKYWSKKVLRDFERHYNLAGWHDNHLSALGRDAHMVVTEGPHEGAYLTDVHGCGWLKNTNAHLKATLDVNAAQMDDWGIASRSICAAVLRGTRWDHTLGRNEIAKALFPHADNETSALHLELYRSFLKYQDLFERNEGWLSDTDSYLAQTFAAIGKPYTSMTLPPDRIEVSSSAHTIADRGNEQSARIFAALSPQELAPLANLWDLQYKVRADQVRGLQFGRGKFIPRERLQFSDGCIKGVGYLHKWITIDYSD